MAKKSKKNNSKFFKMLSFILLLFSVISASIIIYFDIIPKRYLILGGGILAFIILFIIIKLNCKIKTLSKLIYSFFGIIIIFIELIGIIYAFGTIEFFNNIFDTGLRNQNYQIYVLNDSNYNRIKDLENKTIGYQNDINSKALSKLQDKITFNKVETKSIDDLIEKLNNKEIDAFITLDNLINIYTENTNIELKLIDSFDITIKDQSEFKKVDITKKSFAIYISGVDTTGNINKSSRSDVNLLLFVNPNTNKILILNTPRDYYILLASKNAYDKLTHAGIYGVNESAKSLELLYETNINYYLRVNFTSFIKIIDTIGNITVNVEKPDYRYNEGIDCGINYICEQNSNREFGDKMIYIKSGTQSLNGEQALAYARNRHQYANGDNARGKHQIEIIKAIMQKIQSTNTITNYNNILNNISKSIITNIEQKDITKIINYQLDNNCKWEINTYSVKGIDDYAETYSLGKLKSYVLKPDENSLQEAKGLIKTIMN